MFAEEIKKLVKHSGVYGAGIIASKAVGFLMIPVYTRFLVPGDYGTLELLDLLCFFATNLATLSVDLAVFRFYGAYESEKDKREVITTALLYTAAGSLLCSAVLFLFASPVSQLVLGSPATARYIRIVSLTFFFSNLCEVPLAYWRVRERSAVFVGIGLTRTLVNAVSITVALVVLKWGVLGVLYANLLTNVIAGLSLSGIVLYHSPKRIVIQKLSAMLRYSSPLVISGFASFVLVFSDRFFLRKYGSLADVGIYALGYKLAMVVNLMVGAPFRLTWQWQQFDFAKKPDAKSLHAKVQVYQLLVSVGVGLGIALMAKDVLRIVSPMTYWGAAHIVSIIALCYILDNVRSVIVSGVLIQRTTRSLIPIAAVAAAIDIILNFLLIPRFLAMGAAVATLLAYLTYLAMTHFIAQRVYPVPYEYNRNIKILGSAALIYLASTFFNLGLVSSILVHSFLLALFVMVSLRILDKDERNLLRRTGSTLVQRLRGVFEGA